MQAKPDYENMSGAELLAAYNSMAEKPRTSKFETKADAVRKCNALWAQKSGALKVVATNGPELEPSKEKENYPAPKKREPLKRDIKAAQKVEILYEGTYEGKDADMGNPRTPGTGAWEAFEILRKCETRGEYFSHFTTPREKKDAGLRLKHNEKEGYVRIVKAK
jgi:hypothetical protein